MTKSRSSASGEKISFEDSLKRLEQIVQKLEEGELSLDESLKLFEEGIEISRACTKKLSEAEKKVEKLIKMGQKFKTEKLEAQEEE
jgi:exodeoxyribonuclease VII small subunit